MHCVGDAHQHSVKDDKKNCRVHHFSWGDVMHRCSEDSLLTKHTIQEAAALVRALNDLHRAKLSVSMLDECVAATVHQIVEEVFAAALETEMYTDRSTIGGYNGVNAGKQNQKQQLRKYGSALPHVTRVHVNCAHDNDIYFECSTTGISEVFPVEPENKQQENESMKYHALEGEYPKMYI